jgi:autophagy-related protein 5
MSLADTEISKNIWNGKIPIKISLDPTETDVYGTDKVWDPIYVRLETKGFYQGNYLYTSL